MTDCPVGFLNSEGPTPRRQNLQKGSMLKADLRHMKGLDICATSNNMIQGKGREGWARIFRQLGNCYLGVWKEKKL